MVSVGYGDFHSIMHITASDMTAAVTEDLLDQAIDLLNLYSNVTISNMNGGAAGSKTVTLTSAQRGAVFLVARALYYSFYKDVNPSAAGGIAITPRDVLSDPVTERLIMAAAKRISEKTFERI